MHKTAKILYMFFNTACIIILAYQVYLWFKAGTWVSIATNVIMPVQLAKWQDYTQWRTFGTIWNWILNVELMYTLSLFAMLFYVFRFFPDKKSEQKDTSSINLTQG
jgi:hypothetical protein